MQALASTVYPQRRRAVTIIVGIKCVDGIVLASDSQTTTGTQKRIEPTKFGVIQMLGSQALVAQSGGAALSERVLEILQKLASEKSIDDYRTLPDLAQRATRMFLDELRVQQGDCDWGTLKGVVKHYGGCELMLAYYHRDQPYLFNLDIELGIAHKVKGHCAAIGCGGNLGEYLLTEHATDKMSRNLATATAIYIVEMVKRGDAFCGGPTRVGVIRAPMPKPSPHYGDERKPILPDYSRDVVLLEDEHVAEVVREMLSIEQSAKSDRNKQILASLNRLAEERLRKSLESYE